MKKDFDKLWDEEFTGTLEPDPNFIYKLEKEALSHAEKKVKFRYNLLIYFLCFTVLLICLNFYLSKNYTENENLDQSSETNMYVPVKDIYYE